MARHLPSSLAPAFPMPRPPQTNAEKIRALPWALGGNTANIIYANLASAGPVFLLFLNKTQIGLVLSMIRLLANDLSLIENRSCRQGTIF